MNPSPKQVSTSPWLAGVVFAWSLAILSADLKVNVVSYVHWLITFAALAVALPVLPARLGRFKFPGRTAAGLFVAAIVIGGFTGTNLGYSIFQAAKMIFILLGALALFMMRTRLAHVAFRAFVASLHVNLILLVCGLLGLSNVAMDMAVGRWGTLVNFPGSLWRVGIMVWVFAAYLLVKRHRPIQHMILLLGSGTVIYFDGSRTAVLLLVASTVYLLLILNSEAGPSKVRLAVPVAILVCTLALFAGAWSALASGVGEVSEVGAWWRVRDLVTFLSDEGLQGFEQVDIVRAVMLQHAVESITEHPFLGTGIGTTIADTAVGPMVVHMAYLQVWADMGLLGLAAYLFLVLRWIPLLPRTLARIRSLSDPEARALYYNSVFLLFVFALTGLFHPLSTEWTEWITFIVPYALLWELLRANTVRPGSRVIEAHV